VTWSLGVTVEPIEDNSSPEYMEVWCLDAENIVFVSNIMYKLSNIRIWVVIVVDRLQVVFESDSSSLDLQYNARQHML
jgi:hypothetical protein